MISIVECRDDSPPGIGNRGGFSSSVSGTLGIQVSIVATEFQIIICIVMISIVEYD